MNTIDFFEYLVRNEATRELAHQLADAWVSREVGYVPEQLRPPDHRTSFHPPRSTHRPPAVRPWDTAGGTRPGRTDTLRTWRCRKRLQQLAQRVSNWGRWGAGDQRGT